MPPGIRMAPHIFLRIPWVSDVFTPRNHMVWLTAALHLNSPFHPSNAIEKPGIKWYSETKISIMFFDLFVGVGIVLAEPCGIPITPPWFAIAFLTNLLISIAVPPVPGGATMGFFSQLGIPTEIMGVAIAINAIADFPAAACNASSRQLTMINVAESLNMRTGKYCAKSKPTACMNMAKKRPLIGLLIEFAIKL